MRAIATFILVMLCTTAASAQLAYSPPLCTLLSGLGTTCQGGVAAGATCSPTTGGGTLTCNSGGQYQTFQPLIGSLTRWCQCFPENQGPTGPTGATGATGPAGPGATFADATGARVVGLTLANDDSGLWLFWDGHAYWFIDPDSEHVVATTLSTLLYTNSSCTSQAYLEFDRRNLATDALTGTGVHVNRRNGALASPGSSCWAWNGSSCAVASCVGVWTLAVDAGAAPDLSQSYTLPFHRSE